MAKNDDEVGGVVAGRVREEGGGVSALITEGGIKSHKSPLKLQKLQNWPKSTFFLFLIRIAQGVGPAQMPNPKPKPKIPKSK